MEGRLMMHKIWRQHLSRIPNHIVCIQYWKDWARDSKGPLCLPPQWAGTVFVNTIKGRILANSTQSPDNWGWKACVIPKDPALHPLRAVSSPHQLTAPIPSLSAELGMLFPLSNRTANTSWVHNKAMNSPFCDADQLPSYCYKFGQTERWKLARHSEVWTGNCRPWLNVIESLVTQGDRPANEPKLRSNKPFPSGNTAL